MVTRTDSSAWAPDPEGRDGAGAATTDGRQLRRERNRNAVVEALLDLYREGNLQPGTEEIAARSGLSPRSLFRYFDDVDDLTRTAIRHQEHRVMHLVPIEVAPDRPLDVRVRALVDQRFRLFEAVGHAATVARLRSPFQPVLAEEVHLHRLFLRSQIATLFAPELADMEGIEPGSGEAVLAAADVLTSFESCQLLLQGQSLRPSRARAVVVGALSALLGSAEAGPGSDRTG
jgi:AcrR family transcriptional regulator